MPLVEAVRGESHNPIFWTLFGLSWASVWLWLFVPRQENLKEVNGPRRRREHDSVESVDDGELILSDGPTTPSSQPVKTLTPRFVITQAPG